MAVCLLTLWCAAQGLGKRAFWAKLKWRFVRKLNCFFLRSQSTALMTRRLLQFMLPWRIMWNSNRPWRAEISNKKANWNLLFGIVSNQVFISERKIKPPSNKLCTVFLSQNTQLRVPSVQAKMFKGKSAPAKEAVEQASVGVGSLCST